jgi:hypothetical protein
MKKPKIIIWDVETSPIEGTFWRLWMNGGISHKNITKDWWIICGSWKELGSPKVHAVAITQPEDDYEVVKKLRDVVASADVLIHHNGDKFDLKKLNARIIYHGLDPLPPVATVDTLKEVRKIAAFSSNRLDYIANLLLGIGKIDVEYSLWQGAIAGNKRAIKDMVEYNKQDVVVLEKVYEYLKPYFKTHPHVGAMLGHHRFDSCPKCGSQKYKKNGTKFYASGIKKQECQCTSCHSYFKIPVL